MSDRLSLSQVAALMAYAATRAGGQLLFKTPALRGAGDGPLAERIAGFLLKGYFFVALIPYAALTVLWVWILSFTQLSPIRSSRLLCAHPPGLFAKRALRLVSARVILCGLFFIAG